MGWEVYFSTTGIMSYGPDVLQLPPVLQKKSSRFHEETTIPLSIDRNEISSRARSRNKTPIDFFGGHPTELLKAKENPFYFPADPGWISLRQKDTREKKEQRRLEREKCVSEKTTFQSRARAFKLPFSRDSVSLHQSKNKKLTQKEEAELFQQSTFLQQKKFRVRPVENEFTHQFIQRKREIFLVNFAIKTKLDEISYFKKKTLEAEEQLNRDAERIHQDALNFDEFLKQTDQGAVEAMKQVEVETKLKQKKIMEHRRLLAQISVLKADLAKKDDLLFEQLSFKRFLLQVAYNLTSSNEPITVECWIKKKQEMIDNSIAKITAASSKPEQKEKSKSKRKQAHIQQSNKALNSKKDQEQKKLKKKMEEKQSLALAKVRFPEEWSHPELCEQDTDKLKSLLENPDKLVKIMRNLEDENLKLIFHYQNSQENLEEFKLMHKKTARKIAKNTSYLKGQVLKMERICREYENKALELKFMCEMTESNDQPDVSDRVLQHLTEKIKLVYNATVCENLLVNIDAIVMLTGIENKMQELLTDIEEMPQEIVREIRMAKSKLRRQQLREAKLQQERERQLLRAMKAQRRALTTHKKVCTRKLMRRSSPTKNIQKIRTDDSHVVKTDSQLFLGQE